MSEYIYPTVTLSGLGSSGSVPPLAPTVEDAKRSLKRARKLAKAQRAADKATAKANAQAVKNATTAIRALREVAKDDREYSADARVAAARALLENS